MRELFEVYSVFFRIGALTFGGGYTMLPLLQAEIARSRKWVGEEDIIDYYAISQSLPGIVAVNNAMLIGYRRRASAGLLAAALGVVTPSVVIILIIAAFIKNFLHIGAVAHAFNGIRVAVAALIVGTAIDMGRKCLSDYRCIAIFLASLLMFALPEISPIEISPIVPVVAGAAVGVALKRRSGS
ncbi:MAG: chromate transporter [Synergistaceae bacterium]|jgi:chromate transporter|nr:chromate transporter [Synergistaceae bacterium]